MDAQLLSSPALRLPPVLLVLLVLQLAVVRELPVLGASADVLLAAAVAAGLAVRAERAAALGLVIGLAYDLVVQTPFGLTGLTFCLVAHGVARFQAGWLRPTWWLPLAVMVVAGGLGVTVYALLATVLGVDGLLGWRVLTTAVVVGVLNGAWGVLVRPVVGWAVRGGDDDGRGRGR